MDYRVETIKRQTRAVYGCSVAGQSPLAWARTAQPIDFMPALSVTQQCHCSCSMRLVALRKCRTPSPYSSETEFDDTYRECRVSSPWSRLTCSGKRLCDFDLWPDLVQFLSQLLKLRSQQVIGRALRFIQLNSRQRKVHSSVDFVGFH